MLHLQRVMSYVKAYFKSILLLSLLTCSVNLSAEEYFVTDKDSWRGIAHKLVAGDNVVLQDGVWQDFEVVFTGQGTELQPITLTAQTKGKVILSGQSNLRLAGQHLHVSGLVFKNGYTPSSAVIEFRRNKHELAYHSRVSEVVIDNYNNPDKQESDYWVALYGQYNRFDHNHLVGKRNKGVTVAVRLNSEQSQQNHHLIDHNYFGYRPVFGSNGGETLRIGTSHYSLTDSFTRVENNLFEHTNGEVEIISVKSGKNQLRGNVFLEAQGTLTLRHGNNNLIEENVFLGNGVPHTGGIRVINKNQTVRNNYLEGLTGYRFGSGFTVMNGVPDSPINRYHQVENARIENNTFIDVEHIHLAAGSDAERSAVPVNSHMQNNLIINHNGQQPFSLFDDVSGIRFKGNVTNTSVPADIGNGFIQKNVALQVNQFGLKVAADEQLNAGAKADLKVIGKTDVGVSWYPKVAANTAFDSGMEHNVAASGEALQKAINNADSGDILVLAEGHYEVSKLLYIDKVLTIKASKPLLSSLAFARSTLFEIRDGGSLKLDGLVITGASSPDAAGNSVVRTKKWGMVENYRLEVHNSTLKDLNINHSFHFFVSGKGAFADDINLRNNDFSSVTGDVIQLNREIEDLGIYNAEYVDVSNNRFVDVQGAIVKLYRGGTDESTFGPHLMMQNNELHNVGRGKRNKDQTSVFLHGTQVSNINNNRLLNCAPVRIEHTVGEPKTAITDNHFIDTAQPAIDELHVSGPHTAVVKNNKTQ